MNLRTAAALLFLVLAAAPAAAQTLPSIGSRIRVSAPAYRGSLEVPGSARWHVGTLKSLDSAFIVVRTADTEISLPFDLVQQIEVSEGILSSSQAERRGVRRGAAFGASLATGLFLFMKATDCTRCPERLKPTVGNAALGVGVGTAGGAVLGLKMGNRARERWTPVPVSLVRPPPRRSGAGNGLSLSVGV